MDLAKYCVAARVDPSCVNGARRVLLYGRATAPRGFFRLQQEPLCLSPYQAARLLHYCVDVRTSEKMSDVLDMCFLYARTGDETEQPHAATLAKLVHRAGVTDPHRARGVVHAMTWVQKLDAAEMIYLACGLEPYAALTRAIQTEASHVRRIAWTGNSEGK